MGQLKMQSEIVLDVPIMRGEGETKTLTMRRPKVKDQMKHYDHGRDEMTTEGTFHMYADLCGLTPEEMGEIDLQDYPKFNDAYERFFEQAQMVRETQQIMRRESGPAPRTSES